MEDECKGLFGLGMFVMFLIYFYFEIIWSIVKHKTIKNEKA